MLEFSKEGTWVPNRVDKGRNLIELRYISSFFEAEKACFASTFRSRVSFQDMAIEV